MKIGLTLLGGFELSFGNDKTQSTQNENISNELSVQQPTKLIGYDKHGESMYNRLQRLCHPKNFVGNNYDRDKLAVANLIYSQLMSIDQNDICAVIELAIRTEYELHYRLLDEYQYNVLKDFLNPKNFMQPYDASSIALSNELYSQLMQPNLDFTKYLQIVTDAEPLLKIIEERQNEQLKTNMIDKEVRDWYFSC